MGIAIFNLPSALHMAEILYAEDFDKAGFVPAWFAPWHLAMQHPHVTKIILLIIGIALIVGGRNLAKQQIVTKRWLSRTCWIAVICCILLASALIPLATMGGNWPIGTPAYDVRHKVIWSIGFAWLEVIFLLGTIYSLGQVSRLNRDI